MKIVYKLLLLFAPRNVAVFYEAIDDPLISQGQEVIKFYGNTWQFMVTQYTRSAGE